MVVVISCHLGLLMLMLRPVIRGQDATPVVQSNPRVLQLHFFRQPQPTSAQLASTARQPIALTPRTPKALSWRPSKLPPVQRAEHVAAPPSETQVANTPISPNPYTGDKASTGDGGFQKRLLNAQHSYAVRGVPGSDTPFAPSIHLINPMNQGLGAVMRNAQRLFGVANRHCIDVEAWRQLTPQELIARHISLEDVDKVDEKYECNRPPGLSF